MVAFNHITEEQKKVAILSALVAVEQRLIAAALRGGLVPEELLVAEYIDDLPSEEDDPILHSLVSAMRDYKRLTSLLGENYQVYTSTADVEDRKKAVDESIAGLEMELLAETLLQGFEPDQVTFDFESSNSEHDRLKERLTALKQALEYKVSLGF